MNLKGFKRKLQWLVLRQQIIFCPEKLTSVTLLHPDTRCTDAHLDQRLTEYTVLQPATGPCHSASNMHSIFTRIRIFRSFQCLGIFPALFSIWQLYTYPSTASTNSYLWFSPTVGLFISWRRNKTPLSFILEVRQTGESLLKTQPTCTSEAQLRNAK
jgi:hypothetical protein